MTFTTRWRWLKNTKAAREALLILILAVLVFAVSATFDIFNKIIDWVYHHDTWKLDEVFTVALFLVFAFAIFSWRRYSEMMHHMRLREKAEAETAQLVPELERALDDIAAFRRILPVCPSCMRVRDTKGDWYNVKTYMELHLHTRFNDGLCPSCARKVHHVEG